MNLYRIPCSRRKTVLGLGVPFPPQMYILIYSLCSCQMLWMQECVNVGYSISERTVSFYSLSMEIPLTNQLILGLGSPLTRQVRMPVSFGARIRFLGALTQKGAAVDGKHKEDRARSLRELTLVSRQ